MKRTLSLVLAVLMVLSALAVTIGAAKDANGNWIPDNSKWDSISKDGVVARFAIGADIHFQYYNAGGKNEAAYNAFKQIGGVDAYLIAGDLTHYGHHDEYTSLMESVNAGSKKNELNPNATGDSVGMTILSMGNHEYGILDPSNPIVDPEARFTEYTSQQPDALYWINGIPVIALSPDNMKNPRTSSTEPGGCYDASAEFLKSAYAEIDSKGYKGLIIMIAHHRPGVNGNEGTSAWPQSMLDMMKAHPNTMIFTGHSHTWIGNTKYFILQDSGFTHVRAGSLGNDYGGLGDGYINAETGKTSTPLGVKDDSNASCVLVDIMADGTAKLRRMDIAKGEYMFEDEEFIVRPNDLDDYLYNDESAGWDNSYGAASQKPSFPANMKITVEDQGNNSSVVVKFPEAIPASKLARDFVAEYRVRLKTPALDEKGNVVTDKNGAVQYTYLKNGDKNYFRVANYRSVADEGKDWAVTIHGLAWNTDYTVEVRAVTSYGEATSWIAAEKTVNVGEGKPNYPAIPVLDFDYSYGSVADGAGSKLVVEPTRIKDEELNGQKAVNYLGLGGKPWAYEFTEEDFLSIKDFFVMEAYFSASNVTQTQCIMGGWDSAKLGFKIDGGKLNVWAAFASVETSVDARNVASAEIKANTWYHAVAVYNGLSIKLYINGELVDENANVKGGLDTVSYVVEGAEDDPEAPKVTKCFAVAAGQYDADGAMYPMAKCSINKAALYSGVMTAEDVKNAYKIATTAVPFTDVEDGWYIDSVEYAYATGLMNGSSASTFSPSVKTNRAMIVQMLYNMEGRPAVDTKNNPFTDIPSDAWYAPAVLWAYQNGVTTGTSATTFSPDALVTREQVAVFLYRYQKDYKKAEMGEGADLSSFPDADKISPYAGFAEAMAWANANGIIGGKKNGSDVTLSPLDQAMRSEVAKMFVSFDKKF